MSLLHEQWHQVAGLRLSWCPGVRMDRQPVREQIWYLLSDETARRTVRLDARAYAIVGRCDGRRTLDQIWRATMADPTTQATTQGDLMGLVANLVHEGLLDCENATDLIALDEQRQQRQRQHRRERRSPWAPRLALGDPSRWLARCDGLAHCLFSPAGALAWLLLVGAGGLLAIDQSATLMRELSLAMASPSAWLQALMVFIPMKALHEFSHALAVRRSGGNVHEAGIGLLFGIPAPYVDASQASRFALRTQRALVSAAGILTELALAAAALIVWAQTDSGSLAHRLALVTALTGGISTLWFNANPLARMDGYYLLTDIAGLPNLAERSAQWWRETLILRLLGIPIAQPLRPAQGERGWLLAYAPAACAYRVAVFAWLTMWLGGLYAPLGIAIASLAIFVLVALPIVKLARYADALAGNRAQRHRKRLRMAGLTVAVLAALALPVPDRVVAIGIVWIPEPAQLRAGDDGFVVELHANDGQHIVAGQPVLRLDDPTLHADARRLEAQREQLMASRSATLFADPARGAALTDALRQLDEERERLQARIASLQATAPVSGQLRLPFAEDLPGRFYRRGERIADVVEAREPTVRLALSEDQATRLDDPARRVYLGFAHRPWQAVEADLLGHTPAPLEQLPSAALARHAGGPIEVEPRDDGQLKPLRPVYAVDVRARERLLAYPGERVDVRIDCGWQPLVAIAARELAQTFRAGFSTQSL